LDATKGIATSAQYMKGRICGWTKTKDQDMKNAALVAKRFFLPFDGIKNRYDPPCNIKQLILIASAFQLQSAGMRSPHTLNVMPFDTRREMSNMWSSGAPARSRIPSCVLNPRQKERV